MALPGRTTSTVDQSAPRGLRLRLATPLVIGEIADANLAAEPVLIRSLRDLQNKAGARTTDSADVHDWFEAHFEEGGTAGYLMPLRGPAAVLGGDQDFDGITNTEITAAARAFSDELGPGHYVLPGRTDTASHLAVAAVADTFGGERMVKVQLADTATVATLTTAAATLRASAYADLLDICGVHMSIPGLADGTARTVPMTAIRSGIEGRNDEAGESPNQPAAGRWGIARYATAVTHSWSDANRETLNDAGVNVAIVKNGDLRLYGSRTAVDPATDAVALRLGSARLRMAVVQMANYEAERLVFGEIDQGGVELGNLKGRLTGRINKYQRSLYFLSVDAELLEDTDNPGQYYVEVTVTFQAAPDAERVSVIISRAITEV